MIRTVAVTLFFLALAAKAEAPRPVEFKVEAGTQQLLKSALPVAVTYWVTTAHDRVHDGTQIHPYDGSTAAAFDSVLANLPEGATLMYLPGTFSTAGQYYTRNIKTGQKHIGSGIGVTVIQRLSTGGPKGDNLDVFRSYSSTNILISDMTIDCNFVPGVSSKTKIYNGVILDGSSNTITRVLVKTFYGGNTGSGAGAECYSLAMITTEGVPSSGNVISYCIVTNGRGGGMNGPVFLGSPTAVMSDGLILSNKVYLPTLTNQAVLNDSGGCATRNLTISGNYFEGGVSGVYSDTYWNTNVLVINNTFTNCLVPLFLVSSSSNGLQWTDQLRFISNNCYLPHYNYTCSCGPWGIRLSGEGGARYTNIVVLHNLFRRTASTNSGDLFWLVNVDGFTFATNMVDSSLLVLRSGCTNVSIHDNVDLNGFPYSLETVPPTIDVMFPATNPLNTMNPFVSFYGNAADNFALSIVSWTNNGTGAHGLASGSSLWSFNLKAVSGSNTVTVTATDTSGNTTSTNVLVVYAPALSRPPSNLRILNAPGR